MLGPLPDEIQNFTTFTATIPSQTKQTAAATEPVKFLRTPGAAAVLSRLLDDVIGKGNQLVRNCDTERFRRFKIDDQFKLN